MTSRAALSVFFFFATSTVFAAGYPAYDYAALGKTAKLEIVGTDALPEVRGEAKIKPEKDAIETAVTIPGLAAPSLFGPEFLTYVLWAVAPDGDATNLGELPPGSKATLSAIVGLPSFSLVVSAEPYAAVTAPSEWVVAFARPDAQVAATLASSEATPPTRAPGFYRFGRSETDLALVLRSDKKTPAELVQARNALEIARRSGAERHAMDEIQEARAILLKAEDSHLGRGSHDDVVTSARSAMAAAEMARGLAIEKAAVAARAQQEREAALARKADEARQQVEFEAQERAAVEKRLAAEQERRKAAEAQAAEAGEAREAAEARAAEASRMRDEANAAASSAAAAREAVMAARTRETETTAGAESVPTGETARVAQAAEFEAERARIAAERAKLEAERSKLEADLEVERARMAAEQANLAAQRSAEALAKEREEGAAVRAEAQAAKEAAELARVEAERAKLDAELVAERARMEAERTTAEAEQRAKESVEAARLAEEERQKAAANAEALAAMEADRARLQREMAEQQRILEAERLAMGQRQQETAQRQAAMEAEQARLESDRAQLQLEVERQRMQIEAERAAVDRAREADRLARESAAEAAAAADVERQRQADLRMQEEMERKIAEEQARLEEEFRLRRDQQAAADRTARRARLLQQITEVLEAQDSERGLLVRMTDASFDPGRFELKPAVREKLARVAGILVANPSLTTEVEGHTDSTGNAASNQTLSEKRAEAVRDYLVSQGVSAESVRATGFGSDLPVDVNDTPDGRRKNRRVDLILSGDAIGTQ